MYEIKIIRLTHQEMTWMKTLDVEFDYLCKRCLQSKEKISVCTFPSIDITTTINCTMYLSTLIG